MKERSEKEGRGKRGGREGEGKREMTTVGRRGAVERKAVAAIAGIILGSMPGISDTVLISSGCHNKVPQAGWLKQQRFIFSHF